MPQEPTPHPDMAHGQEPFCADEKVNILVVDDLPEKLLAYQAILEELGQNLVTVQSGEAALKELLRHEFAVILLDVNMPEMDGFETANLIRKRRKSAHTPIIFLTAFSDEVYVNQGYASGAVDYLLTPVVPEILKTKVKVFIELSRMRKQAASQAEERARRTLAEESAARWGFLSHVGQKFARAHTQDYLLEMLVRESVPFLADVSIVRISNQENKPEQVKYAWADMDALRDPELTEFSLQELSWLEEPIREVKASGEYRLLTDLTKRNCALSSIIAPLKHALILPVEIGNKVCGVFVLARNDPYPSAHISLAKQLVSRMEGVFENIMLIERIREADRRKDEFLGMLAHELRNPLGPIQNAIYLLQMTGPREPRLQQISDIVERQVRHMSRLIDDLLDATRVARGKILLRRERCDLASLVRQTAEDYRTIFDASGLEQELHLPSAPVWVDGDPTRLVQAIGNLLHNAHKFTNPGGMVIIRLEAGEETATVSVRDTGIGIDPKMLPCVFDVFRQAEQGLDRSQGGLGLGLALVKGLVHLHNGEVAAFSEGPGKGAEFILRLPVEPQTSEVTPSVPVPLVPKATKYRILIIEDNRDTAESVRLLLSMEGHEVQTAHTGLAGLDIAKSFQPEVILCDIGLPGMDGYQVTRAIRQDDLLSDTHIIALTGYGRDEDQRQAHEAGFDMHLTKPIDYTNLRRVLASLPARRPSLKKNRRAVG